MAEKPRRGEFQGMHLREVPETACLQVAFTTLLAFIVPWLLVMSGHVPLLLFFCCLPFVQVQFIGYQRLLGCGIHVAYMSKPQLRRLPSCLADNRCPCHLQALVITCVSVQLWLGCMLQPESAHCLCIWAMQQSACLNLSCRKQQSAPQQPATDWPAALSAFF